VYILPLLLLSGCCSNKQESSVFSSLVFFFHGYLVFGLLDVRSSDLAFSCFSLCILFLQGFFASLRLSFIGDVHIPLFKRLFSELFFFFEASLSRVIVSATPNFPRRPAGISARPILHWEFLRAQPPCASRKSYFVPPTLFLLPALAGQVRIRFTYFSG